MTTTTDRTTGTKAVAPRAGDHAAYPARLPRIEGGRPETGIPFARLARVELRKMVDTRAGRWLLITIGVVIAAILTILFFVEGGAHGYEGYFGATSLPLMILVPIVGIMAATAEWSQRTGLTTFALEPRRHRVVLAKVFASLVAAAAALVTALGLAALVNVLAVQVRGADSSWTLSWGLLAGVALVLVLNLAQGVGFGLSLLNTPAAIVAYLVLPTAWSFVTGIVKPMRTAGEWLDLTNATTPLLEGAAMHARDWAQVGTASALWVVVPLAIGLWRVTRSEVK